MSNGPEGYDPDEGVEPGATPEEDGPVNPAVEAALVRVNIPGILLIIVGVLNVLGGGYTILNGGLSLSDPEQVIRQLQESPFTSQNATPEMVRWFGIAYIVVGILQLISSGLIVMAGARMRLLRGYGFAMTGAILALIPCLSPSVCCFGLGMVAGIWALVVLANPEVRSAFE